MVWGDSGHPAEILQSCLKINAPNLFVCINYIAVLAAAVTMKVILIKEAAWILFSVKRA